MKRTKIVTTIGPATESPENLKKLMTAGANIFRLNLKHNTHDWHEDLIKKIRKISDEEGHNIAIMADLQGPELRIGKFNLNVEKVTLNTGDKVVMSKTIDPDEKLVNIEFPKIDLVEGLKPGMEVSIDDGKIVLKVEETERSRFIATVEEGGDLGIKKSVSIPEAHINVPTLVEKDIKDLEFAIKNEVDFVALSFVRNGRDITTLREKINEHGGAQHIIAKIENLHGVENIEEIVKLADGIMVARGDLGIEVPMERVPSIQENLIKLARENSKPVIVATQMLMSMVNNPIPTRAEVSDIAHAVYDGTDALMLSEETTAGKYPIKAVGYMAKIARYNESHRAHKLHIKLMSDDYTPTSYEEMVIASSIQFSQAHPSKEDKKIKGYIVFTESGKSARALSRYRTDLPIYTFTSHYPVYKQLALSFAVDAYNLKLKKDPVENIRSAIKILKDQEMLESGDKVIVIFGSNVGALESNNTMSIVTI